MNPFRFLRNSLFSRGEPFERRKRYLHEIASRLAPRSDNPLRDIELVKWERVTHAYGWATDVPDCLRIAVYGAPEEREDVQSELQSNIYHQHTLYPATVFAVPFLIRMVAADWVPDRVWLLEYLQSLARASDHVQGRLPPGAPSVREAVSVGASCYRVLATSDVTEIKRAANDLLRECVDTDVSPDWWRSIVG
jgi:hypothetical protein